MEIPLFDGEGIIDLARHQVRRGEETTQLSALEVKLLRFMAKNRNITLERDRLLREVWGYRNGVASRAVDDLTKRLRKKIEPTIGPPRHIHTVRGEGYRFESPIANSPRPAHTLHGREEVVATLESMTAQPGLVSILGPGGVGKTSLAHVLLRSSPRCTFVDLSDAESSIDLLHYVGDAVDAPFEGDTERVVWAIGRTLRGLGDHLLVLDNFEQVVQHSPLLQRWLNKAPALRMVVTSRERLRLPAERVLRLSPLSEEAAVTLFIARAKAAHPSFEATSQTRPVIQKITTLLDGLPLAIELAATRASVLTPQALLERLEKRFTVLRTGWRGAQPRQASLEGALQASWELLSEPERAVLYTCTYFRGGFTIAAVEAVHSQSDTLDLVGSLVDKSLIQPAIRGRLRMLHSVRDFVLAVVEDMPAVGLHFAQWASSLNGTTTPTEEVENLFAATRTALQHSEPILAMEIYTILYHAADRVMPAQPLLILGQEVLAAEGLSPRHRVRLCSGIAGLHTWTGDLDACEDVGEAGMREARTELAPDYEAMLLHVLANNAHRAARTDVAGERFERAIAILRESGNNRRLGSVLLSYGNLLSDTCNADAEAVYLEALALSPTAPKPVSHEGITLANLSNLLRATGRLEEADELCDRALIRLEKSPENRMYALESRGRLLLDRGDPNAAKTQFEQALELAASMGHRRLMASSMAHYACTLARLGAFESSLSAADEALEIVTSIRHKGLEAQVRTSRARCLALAGRREAARTAIDEAMTWAEETQGRRLLGELYILHAQRLADEDPDAARDWLRRAEQAFVDGMSAVQGADLAALAEALAARNR